MNCEEIRETMSAELDGEATDDELARAYGHLADCPACRLWRREILAMKNMFAHSADVSLPSKVTKQLHDTTKSSTARGPQKSMYRVPRPLAWAAAAAFILQVGWSSYQITAGASSGGMDEVDETIVLTARDRISSAVIIRTAQEHENENHIPQNGGGT